MLLDTCVQQQWLPNGYTDHSYGQHEYERTEHCDQRKHVEETTNSQQVHGGKYVARMAVWKEKVHV